MQTSPLDSVLYDGHRLLETKFSLSPCPPLQLSIHFFGCLHCSLLSLTERCNIGLFAEVLSCCTVLRTVSFLNLSRLVILKSLLKQV